MPALIHETEITTTSNDYQNTVSPFGGRRIIAIGDRPQDHRDRDLILGSLRRDYRPRLYREYCSNSPSWAPELAEGVPNKFRPQAHQLNVLGLMHRHFLDRLRESIDCSDDAGQAAKMLDAMEDCMPRGALFCRGAKNDRGRHCGYSKLCPWCHARSVQELYRKLIEGPCAAANLKGKQLVLARVCDRESCGTANLEKRKVQETRESYRGITKQIAADLGIDGGAIFYQFGPMREYGPRASITLETFSPTITMIGESTSVTPEKLGEYRNSGFDLLALPADRPHALRYLLFGTPYAYPLRLIEGAAVISSRFDKDRTPLLTKWGIPGAASLQPWFLFNETQAWSYLAATAGTRLYDAFGTWRKNGRVATKTAKQQPEDELAAEARERDHVSPARALLNANNERGYDAANRRAGLMRKAETVFRKLRAEKRRNPGSTALRGALAAAGLVVSDRDSRYLAKEMPLYYQGERARLLEE